MREGGGGGGGAARAPRAIVPLVSPRFIIFFSTATHGRRGKRGKEAEEVKGEGGG